MEEKLMAEIDRVLVKTAGLEPGSEEYDHMIKITESLAKVLHADMEACEADLNGRHKREQDKQELELNRQKARDAYHQARRDAWLTLGKTGLTIIGIIVSILITGSLEQSTILSKTALSFIKWLKLG